MCSRIYWRCPMPTDIRAVLHGGAALPRRPLDLEAATLRAKWLAWLRRLRVTAVVEGKRHQPQHQRHGGGAVRWRSDRGRAPGAQGLDRHLQQSTPRRPAGEPRVRPRTSGRADPRSHRSDDRVSIRRGAARDEGAAPQGLLPVPEERVPPRPGASGSNLRGRVVDRGFSRRHPVPGHA